MSSAPARARAIPIARWSWLTFPPEMPPDERGVLRSIVAGARAWSTRADLDASYPGAVERLMRTGWVEPWDFPRYEVAKLSTFEAVERGIPIMAEPGPATAEVVTLSEWGADQLGLVLSEHWVYRSIVEPKWAGAGKPRKRVHVRVAEAVARWAPVKVTTEGVAELAEPEKPLAPGAVEGGLPIPLVAVELKARDKMEVLDADSGKPLKLFAGGTKGGGYPVVIDPRLARKPIPS